ncbi:hypothetical protein [Stakelama marina]|uniref:Uncharacterized protein n=1 Tax=Stakelama marina TaxID=2826939 RepID=A0A8T4IKU3_9SPHN|nr:hypothetical protein [Stakelama marina]MBR0553735.1 hypothetical protein [Stakelama marina]
MKKSLRYFRSRTVRRLIGDLPIDLAEAEVTDPLGLLRSKVPAALGSVRKWEQGKPAPMRRAWFHIPSCAISSRETSSTGERPFHFAKNITWARSAAQFDRYGTQKGGPESGLQRERPAAEFDGYTRNHGGGERSRPDMITSLSPDDAVRVKQWDAIEAEEAKYRKTTEAGSGRINIRFERDPEFLIEVARRNDCPAGLRDVILAEAARVETGSTLSQHLAKIGVPWINEDAASAFKWLKQLPGFEKWRDDKKPPAKLSKGRRASTVFAADLELPTELDRRGRLAVLAGLDTFVQGQAPKTDAERAGPRDFIPLMLVLHEPDALNDARNQHAHLQHSLRRARWGDDGELVFAQNKSRGLTRIGYPMALRCEAARLINIELERLRVEYRLSPASYAKLGINVRAQRKLETNATVLSRAGDVPPPDLYNAAEGWQRKFDAAARHRDLARDELDRRDGKVRTRIAGLDEQNIPALQDARSRARSDAEEAIDLRYEAEQISLFAEMAKSRAARTARYAPEYAAKVCAKARGKTFLADCWSKRGREAEDYLQRIDVELNEEREAIEERLVRAEELEAQATQRYQALIKRVADLQPETEIARVPTPGPVARPDLGPHQILDLVSSAPLLLSQEGKRYVVRAEDDPEGLLNDKPLPADQRRVEGIFKAQQRELAQLRAYLAKRGEKELTDLIDPKAHDWLSRCAVKWSHTPTWQRLIETRRIERSRQIRRKMITEAQKEEMATDLAAELPQVLPERPRTLADLSQELLDRYGVILGSPDMARGPEQGDQDKLQKKRPKPVRSLPAPVDPAPAQAFSSEELALFALEERLRKRERDRRRKEMIEALAARAGDERFVTPLAARLLRKLAEGWDPEKIDSRKPITGPSLDQRDAAEIEVLKQHPIFAERMKLAQAKDPQLLKLIVDDDAPVEGANLSGRVPSRYGRLDFGHQHASGHAPEVKHPSAWAEPILAAAERGELAVSFDVGPFGLHDDRLLYKSDYNYVGLLYPESQTRLEVVARIQREEKRALLRRIARGDLKIEARIERQPMSDENDVRVSAKNGNEEERAVIERHRGDTLFYRACRHAQGAGKGVKPLQHSDAAVRALLNARGEKNVASAVLLRLGREVAERLTDIAPLEPRDQQYLQDLLRPQTSLENIGRLRRGRQWAIPTEPGRGW